MLTVYEWAVTFVDFRNSFTKAKTVEAPNYEDAVRLAFAELAGDSYEAAEFGVIDIHRGRVVVPIASGSRPRDVTTSFEFPVRVTAHVCANPSGETWEYRVWMGDTKVGQSVFRTGDSRAEQALAALRKVLAGAAVDDA